MTLQIPEGFCQVGVLCTNDDSTHVAEFTFGVNWPGNDGTFEQFTEVIEGFASNVLQDSTTNIHSSEFVMTQGADGGGTGSFLVPFSTTIDGAASGDPMTPQVAYLYRKQTTLVGRKHRGRFYLPGCSESHVDGGGVVASSFLTDQRNHATSALNDMSTVIVGVPFDMVLLHSDPALAPTPVAGLLPEGMVATQRRRLKR